jgi:large repetitive protein
VADTVYTQLCDTTSYTIVIKALLTIVTQTIPDMKFNAPYDTTVCTQYGTAPFHWSVIGGYLPAGISLDSTSVANATCLRIHGTPDSLGDVGGQSVTFRVQGSGGPADTAIQFYSYNVGSSPITILTTSIPADTAGQSYDQRLNATGGSGLWRWTQISSSQLLPGLTFTPDFGDGVARISGTPSDSGICTLTVAVTDTFFPNLADTATYIIRVMQPFHIITDTLPLAFTGAAYDTGIATKNGVVPVTWNLLSGSLPQGLDTASRNSGAYLGFTSTPIMGGIWNIQYEAVDGAVTAHRDTVSLSITVLDSLKITTDSTIVDTANCGTNFFKNFVVTGGSHEYLWNVENTWSNQPVITDQGGGNMNMSVLIPCSALGNSTYTLVVTDNNYPSVVARRTFTVYNK